MRAHLTAPLLFLMAATFSVAATLTVTVKDPQGAVIPAAVVSINLPAENAPREKRSDAQGRATFDSLTAGSWRVAVSHEGFDAENHNVSLSGDKPADLTIVLKLSTVISSIQVSARTSSLANSDPNYQALRHGRLTMVYHVENLILTRDVGKFTFRSGSFSFLPPVLGHVTTGVFVGDGNVQLKPASKLAEDHLLHASGAASLDEDFTAFVVYFSDATFDEIRGHATLADESPTRHEEALKRVRQVIEDRRDPPLGRTYTLLERLLNYEDIPNYDAELLEELYNAEPGGSFRAFIHGKKNADLRFILNPHGALPTLPAPEEVALINFHPPDEDDGIWYLSHLAGEVQSGHASSNEDKRLVAPEHYKIDSLIRAAKFIGRQPDLVVACNLKFRALQNGVRMVKFDMVPDLQVSRVTFNGAEIPFVQEARNHDGSFYLQLPEALTKDRTYEVAFEYGGGEIIQTKFDGVPVRRIWYPTPAGPANRATYDLIFRLPHGDTLVASGRLTKESQEGRYDVQEWTSDEPISQAVFRFLGGSSPTHKPSLEATTGTPISLWVSSSGRSESVKDLLIDIGNSLRLFHMWFGKPAYPELTVLVAGGFDSMPGLIVVPPWATVGYSSLASQMMVSSRGNAPLLNARFRVGLDEAFPTSIAQQWWGNTVSPVSFHDQWLVQGLTNFSASLFDAFTFPKDEYNEHWSNAREAVVVTGRGGFKANPAGPVWMGLLNDTAKFPTASSALNTSKGGLIFQMLRSIMWERETGDADFQAMMQDFLHQFANRAVSTEDFQSVVEQHMKPAMDLDKNHRMDWFFHEWLLTTEVPSYRLEYSMKPDGAGKTILHGMLTQLGVPATFKMSIPVFGDFSGKKERVAEVAMEGTGSGEFTVSYAFPPKNIFLNINHDILTDKDEVVRVK